LSKDQIPCFISDVRTCHASSPKDVVFIIGSGSPEFKKDINAIVEILDGFGLTGYFALLSEEEKGLDAFCDKICSKIRESQFCVAMLNDPVAQRSMEGTGDRFESMRFPSANVYYEFGMAVALEKHVIPVIRSGFRLPFDVQHLDAIIYDDLLDLNGKLKSSIRSTLQKKKKEVKAANSGLVKLIYGPLYNEINHFLSKKTRFTKFNPSKHQGILSQYKYLLDTIDTNLQKEIELFYDELKEFNSSIRVAKRIIRGIVAEQISDFLRISYDNSLSIYVVLETYGGQMSPTLDAILVQKTTPELFLQAQGILEPIKQIKYELRMRDQKEKMIDQESFEDLFERCQKKVENNPRVSEMRKLEADLKLKGEELKKKLLQFCR